jgi:peptidoglycan/LPS O-acetylase OafA/YrhL
MNPLPSLKHRVDAFDGLRAIAALGVYYCHSGNDIVVPPIVIRGHAGVHLFFVLSGYLLFSPFLKSLLEGTPTPSIRRF